MAQIATDGKEERLWVKRNLLLHSNWYYKGLVSGRGLSHEINAAVMVTVENGGGGEVIASEY